jgi:hypothetical protein
MRTRLIVTTVLAALAAPGAAYAGCAATVGLAAPPAGLQPGETWRAQMLVKQHGVRPLPGAQPTLTIVNDATGERKTFAARATDKVGVYRANVVFPSGGSWSYEAYDGFVAKDGSWTCAQTHTFSAVTIGGPGATTPPPAPAQPASAPAPAPAPAADDGGGMGALVAALLSVALVGIGLGLAYVLSGRRAGRRAPDAAPHA